MNLPFQSSRRRPYMAERDRLLDVLAENPDPTSESYQTVMVRLNELDRILTRSSELKKTTIPALGGIAAVGGIYALQQFGGVLVPKAMEALAARQDQKKTKENDKF